MKTFNVWIDTFLSEKGIDLEESFEVEGPTMGVNHIPVGCLVEMMKENCPVREQLEIKAMLVKIDFTNGDVRKYLAHLAKAVAL